MFFGEKEQGAAIPPALGGKHNCRAVIGSLEVGENVAFPYAKKHTATVAVISQRKLTPKRVFTSRVMVDGDSGEKYVRIWRTA